MNMALTEDKKNILVIYEEKAEEWATYMKHVLTQILKDEGILLYNIELESDEAMEYLSLSQYKCKLLVLTKYLLEILNRRQCTDIVQLLHPSHSVVILLCGVETLDGFCELVPIDRDFHVIFTDQDPQDYMSVVNLVLNEDFQDTHESSPGNIGEVPNIYSPGNISIEDADWEDIEGAENPTVNIPSVLVLPKRILCENPGEIFVILNEELPTSAPIEIEFCTENDAIRIHPTKLNEKVLSLNALEDFPAGPVNVNIYSGDTIQATAVIEYYTAVGEIELLLKKVADPIEFICQAFKVYNLEDLDVVLMKSLQNKISSCELNLHEIRQNTDNASFEEIPTLLHCAAKFGLKEVTHLLMQCPGSDHISTITNKYGDDPAAIAEKHGHKHIQEIINQLPNTAKSTGCDTFAEEEKHDQDDIYTDMEPSAAQKSISLTFENAHEDKKEQHKVTDEDANIHHALEYTEEKENHSVESNSYETLNVEDDYCFSVPVDNATDENYQSITDKDEELFWNAADNNSNIENGFDTKGDEYMHKAEDFIGNICSDVKDTSCKEDMQENKCFPTNVLQSTDPLFKNTNTINEDGILHFAPEERDETNNNFERNNIFCNIPDSHSDDTEETFVLASTDDDLYLVFETVGKERENSEKSSFINRDWPPTTSLLSRQDNEACDVDQEERDKNVERIHETISWNEQDEMTEETNEDQTQQFVFASTDDNLYLIFEPKRKEKSSTVHRALTSEPCFFPYQADETTHISQAEGREENYSEDIEWNETAEYFEEDPYTWTSVDENVYTESSKYDSEKDYKYSQREMKSFILNRSPASVSQSGLVAETESSYMSQERRKENSHENILWDDQGEQIDEENEYNIEEEDPYSCASPDNSIYMALPYGSNDEETQRGRSFIVHRPPAPAPRPCQPTISEPGSSYISLVFREKEEKKMYSSVQPKVVQKKDDKKLYSTVKPKDRIHNAGSEYPAMRSQSVTMDQDELILLQEKVKKGLISVDEALLKFQQWQSEKSELDVLQQKKLQQLRHCIIGDKPEDDKLYDKITIIHQPTAHTGKKNTKCENFDNSIYSMPSKPETPSRYYNPIKKDNDPNGKSPRAK